MDIKSGTNHLIVQIEKPYQKNLYSAIRMANMNEGSQINPADYATITGLVVAVPESIGVHKSYKGYSREDIKVGDTVLFSYLVVHNFNESQNGDSSFKNEFRIGGKYYWVADIKNIFGVISKDGIKMVNGWVMINELPPISNLFLPTVDKKKEVKGVKTKVIAIGNNLTHKQRIGVKEGDSVIINRRKAANYQLNGNNFAIISQKDILAIAKKNQ